MVRKNIIKVLIMGMMLLMVLMLRELELSKTIKGDESAPTLSAESIKWELGSGLYMNNHKYVALGDNLNSQNFLMQELISNPTTEWSSANTQARNLRGSAYFIVPERNIITSSSLVSATDLQATAVESAGDKLSKYHKDVDTAWWLSNQQTFSNIKTAGYVTGDGNLASSSIKTEYEILSGSSCQIKSISMTGYTPMSNAWGIDFGQVNGTKSYAAIKCPAYVGSGSVRKFTYKLYRSTDCTGTPAYQSQGTQSTTALGEIPWDSASCPPTKWEYKADTCLRRGTEDGYESGTYSISMTRVATTGSWAHHAITGTYVTKCRGVLGSHALGIRPAITLDPQSYIIASIPISETPDTSVSSTLKKYTQPNNEMVTGTDYKFQLFDSTQQVTSVSKPSTIQDNLFAVKDNKVQVELGTTEVTLDASVKGAHNYISAMATDKGGSTKLYGKIGTGTAATNSITLDISKIMDTSIVGEKQVNLYSEQINPNTYSDLVSSTPLTVTFEVLPPKSDQILTLDENNVTEMMYGDEITLKAYVNAEDKDLGWATATGTDMQFALVGDDAVNHVNIVKQSFDSTTGIAEVTLKAISGEDAQVQLSVNKKGSHEQRYNDASEVKTPTITIKKREITVTPKKTILQVGDPYPPTWRFDTKMTDTNNKATALVNGDKLPYTVSTSPLEADVNEPTVDASGNVSAENMDKTWKLSVADDPGSDVVSFEKNYLVVRNDYHETKNKKSILEVAKLAYEGMEFIVQPDDVKTLVDEEYTFTAKAMYPLEKGDGTPLTLVEQKVQYQWQQSLDGVNWENVTDGSVNAEYLDGVATFTFTSMKNLEVKDMQYRCIAKNLRDEADNVTAKSDPAGLQVTTEPVTFIMIPKEVEMVDKDKTIAENKKTKEADVIKLYDFDNVVSKNTETKQQVPSGVFDIYTPEKFYLTKDAVEEKQNDKKYEVTVYRSDGKKVSETAGLLMSLDYTNKQQDTFRLTTPVSRLKDVGTYVGIMTFTIKYTPSGGS